MLIKHFLKLKVSHVPVVCYLMYIILRLPFFFRFYWTGGTENFCVLSGHRPSATTTQFAMLVTSCISLARLLQLVNQYQYITTIQSPSFTLGPTLCVHRSVGFDKRMMSCVHHLGIMQNSYTVLRIPCTPLIYPFPATTDFYCLLHSFDFYRMTIVGMIQ